MPILFYSIPFWFWAKFEISGHDIAMMRGVHMRAFLVGVVGTALLAGVVEGQNEDVLRRAFEGKMVTVKLDMPATERGVDVHVQRDRPLSFSEYADRLKDYGTSIRTGGTVMVTKIKVKDDLIEFQLGGGGYGTFMDVTNPSVNVPLSEKTQREKNLENDLKRERDEAKKKKMREELDSLRKERERQDQLARATVAAAEAANRAQIREKALASGSRFNLRWNRRIPGDALTPEAVRAALAQYVEFGNEVSAPLPVADQPAVLRKGLLIEQVEAMFGAAITTSTRREGTLTVSTLVFHRETDRVTADFVEGVLIRYVISSR